MAKRKILIVEDDAVVAMDIQNRLTNLGFSVPAIVPSGEKAAAKAKEHKPDLVLMDIVLKGEMNGIQAADAIRSKYDVPVVYVTAYADQELVDRAKLTEPFGYIIKPFEDKDLNIAIEVALYKHKMEKKLRRSEQWLSTTLSSIGDAVIAADKNEIVTFVNPVAQSLTGWYDESAIGKPLGDVFNIRNEKTRKRVENPVAKVLREGKTVGLANHTLLIAIDGREIPIDDSGAPIMDENGNITGVVLVFRDITERKQAEEALREASEFREKIISESPVGIAIYNAESGQCVSANRSMAEFIGATQEQTLTQNFLEIKSWQQSGLLGAAKSALKDISSKQHEITVKTTFGKDCSLNCHLAPLRVGAKKYLLLNISDITDRQQAEETLREKQAQLQAILDYSPALISIKDLEGTVLLANRNFELLDIPPLEEFIGKTVFELFPKEVAEVLWQNDLMAIEAGEPIDAEEMVTHRDGTLHTYLTVKFPLLDAARKAYGVCAISTDITDRKDAEKEKAILESQLQHSQKMESIGTLAGGIAHDFNNILASVLGFTELSLDDVEKGTNLEDHLQEVYSAGKRARDLVKQILAFARQSDEERKPIQVDTIAKEVLKLIRSTIPTTIEIKEDIQSHSLVMGNPSQVHQLFINLCTNAAQAMEDTGGILVVKLTDVENNDESPLPLSELKSGNYVKITVSDMGPGISMDIIDSIFEPYFTTKAVGEGTGMGLALVHGIVESYDGKIFVDSKLGKGTVFSIYIPVTKRREDYQRYEKEKLPSGTERILFVDDELPIAKMGGQILERLGYQVTVRTSSVEALELFRSKPVDFDLVISDMTMPNMTGDELAIELISTRHDIPVILCTGYSKKISAESAAEIGIKAFAYKPIVKSDLAKTVRKVLDAGRSEV